MNTEVKQDIMDLLYTNSEKIPEGLYIDLSNLLMKLDKKPTTTNEENNGGIIQYSECRKMITDAICSCISTMAHLIGLVFLYYGNSMASVGCFSLSFFLMGYQLKSLVC